MWDFIVFNCDTWFKRREIKEFPEQTFNGGSLVRSMLSGRRKWTADYGSAQLVHFINFVLITLINSFYHYHICLLLFKAAIVSLNPKKQKKKTKEKEANLDIYKHQ